MSKPKEDPKDKAARLRERRITGIERQQTAEESASSLTTDLRAIYGMKGLNRVRPSTPGMVSPRPR
jgi:hypothetical protein